VNDMVRGWLSEMDHGAWLLDGYPRTVAQAETLDHFLNQRGTSVDVVVWMDVSRELIEQRIMRRRECSTCGYVVQTPEEECSKCGGKMVSRKDDNMEAFARRWKDFEAMTLPAARYYEARGLVVKMTVSEEREPAEVSRDLPGGRVPAIERIIPWQTNPYQVSGEVAKMQKAGAVTAILMEIRAEVRWTHAEMMISRVKSLKSTR
ncbi:MAG: adenylate kinase family protein, partial [Akkermansia muciniphila]